MFSRKALAIRRAAPLADGAGSLVKAALSRQAEHGRQQVGKNDGGTAERRKHAGSPWRVDPVEGVVVRDAVRLDAGLM
jgi:hypothetical protein